jgi:hypothetical protein
MRMEGLAWGESRSHGRLYKDFCVVHITILFSQTPFEPSKGRLRLSSKRERLH